MAATLIKLLDPIGNLVATARVAEERGVWEGTIDLQGMPTEMRRLFEEFEEIVNGQMFSFLEDIQKKITALRLKGVYEDGLEANLHDLQIYPSTGEVSFKPVEVSALRSASA
jgi:hypothetical protein